MSSFSADGIQYKVSVTWLNGGSAVGSLEDLSDVSLSAPATDQVLKYNGTTWVNGTSEGGGDMLTSIYDPANVNGDAFSMDNMVETDTSKILTVTERNNISNNTIHASSDGSSHSFLGQNVSTDQSPEFRALQFTVSLEDPTRSTGLVFWNDAKKCLSVYMFGSNVTLDVGLEDLTRVRNVSGEYLDDGTPVSIVGASGNTILIAKTDITDKPSACCFLGITTEAIPNNSNGYVASRGEVSGLDTSSFQEGDILFVGPGGTKQTAIPSAPNFVCRIGRVQSAHASEGVISVGIRVHPMLEDLSNVNGTPATDNSVLKYNEAGSYWDPGFVDHTELTSTGSNTHAQIDTALADIDTLRNDISWNGFTDASDVAVSFVNANRTLTLQPAVSSFSFYSEGIKYTKTGAENIQIPDTNGLHYFYYVGNTLTTTTTFSLALIEDYAFVAVLYWDSANAKQIYFGEEFRHTPFMGNKTHGYLHVTRGFSLADGGDLTDILPDQNGSLDSHAQFGNSLTEAWDEDARFVHSARSSDLNIAVYYKTGTESSPLWKVDESSSYGVLTTGSGRASYNQLTGGNWVQTEVTNTKFVLAHVFTFNDSTRKFGVIQGEAEYATLGEASTGAVTELGNIVLDDSIAIEIKFLGTIIYQTNSGYTNAVKSVIRSTTDGSDYVDVRTKIFATSGSSSALGDHGELLGLTDDDHTHYTLLAGRPGGQVIVGGTQTLEDITFRDNAVDNNTKTLTQIIDHIDSMANPHSVDETDVLPTQAGQSGKFLTTNGTVSSWASLGGGGDMSTSTYDPASISEQLVGLTATQTLTNKTITQPTLTLKQGASPAPTAEGDIQWDTDDDKLKVGNGSTTKTFSDDAYNSSTFAPIAKGVTNGDSHDHSGGDGAQISHASLSGAGTTPHTDIDNHIGSMANPHSVDETDVLPAQAGQSGKFLTTNGTVSSWASLPGGGDMSTATYDPASISEQLVGLTATQTLTNKTITQPTLTLKQGASPAPTAEGDIQWDTDDDKLKVGNGSTTKTFSPDDTLSITASQVSDFDTEVTNNATVASNTTHRTSTGADHTYIDQSVVSGSTPTFTGTNFTGIPDGAFSSGATVTSAGAGDSGKLVKLDANGHIDATAINDGDIDHDSTTNFVANEHINHTSVTLTAGTGLSGGGDISANRTFNLDISGLTEDTEPDQDADFLASYDSSGTTHKKVKPSKITKFANVNNQTGTTYTLALTDEQGVVTLSNASAITLTVPANTSVAFPVGTTITCFQKGAGTVTVSPAGGVTINAEGSANKSNAQHSPFSLVKIATDEWYLMGSIKA